jgi:hypothetical protein
MTDETQALIDKTNQLHAALMEQKKIQSAFWDRYHEAAKKLEVASEALDQGEIDLGQWGLVYKQWKKLRAEDPPKSPDTSAWIMAREDAMEAIAQDAGLRIRVDGL